MKSVKINYDDIPQELKDLDRWACFDLVYNEEKGKDDKKPFTPGTDDFAIPNDVSSLGTFEEAAEDVVNGYRDHIAFCFQEDDPYTFIDGDHTDQVEFRDDHESLLLDFQSYTERSVSGAGFHIIVKGKLEGAGMHADYVQVWDKNRFCIMTGHILKKRDKIRIATKENLKKLSVKIRGGANHGKPFEIEETAWDYSHFCLYHNACANVFKQKFINLFNGDWLDYKEYQDRVGNPDHSKADHALISMMCELTDSNELVRYAFHSSNLFRDWKHPHDPIGYVDRSIVKYRQKVEDEKDRRSRNRELAQENLERSKKAKKAVKKRSTKAVKSQKSKGKSNVADYSNIPDTLISNSNDQSEEYEFITDEVREIPSNLIRRLSMWNLKRSRIPQQGFSMVSSLVQMVSIVQRSILGPSNTGCNMSMWVLAPTGTGKDTFIGCVDAMANELNKSLPYFKDRVVGKFSSGEALDTVLSSLPMFVSKVPEAGAWWRKLLSPQRPPHIDTLAQGMMELFTATHSSGTYQTRKKAKQDENLKTTIFRPAGSFFGESTPEDFFKEFDIHNIDTGLLQRQLNMDFSDLPFVEINENNRYPIPLKLRNDLTALIQFCDQLSIEGKFFTLPITQRSLKRIKDLERKLRIKRHKEGAIESLESKFYSRSVIKIYRIATILAIADCESGNFKNAFVSDDHMKWAIDFVMKHDKKMIDKLNSGEISSGQIKQEADMLKALVSISSSSVATREKKFFFRELVALDETLLTYSHLKMRCKRMSSFRSDRRGGIVAIDSAIDSLCKSGTLSRLTKVEALEEYDCSTNLLRYNGSG